MLANEIRDNWVSSPFGFAATITSLTTTGYEAWTVKTNTEYGVAIPLDTDIVISENFSGAHLHSDKIILDNSEERYALLLTAKSHDIYVPFSSLCAELVYPGEKGEFRKEIMSSPVMWWIQWKELLGNKNVDERVYDILGELTALRYLALHGEHAEWNGPDGATYDIDCDDKYYEIKSTIARNKREITLSNLFQLDPPKGIELFLILCQFEAAQSGVTINGLVKELESIGYSSVALNEKLERLGMEKGKSARNRHYVVHAMLEYIVDASFPSIKDSSFIGGTLPQGVRSITYTISLDGITAKNLLLE